MFNQSVVIRIKAEIKGFTNSLRVAGANYKHFTQTLERSSSARAALEEIGTGFFKIGVAAGAATGLVVKAAADWEYAMSGVAKAVTGSDEELRKLNDDLRELARNLPTAHEEIAALALQAGQLGIATKDISKFTETMIKLEETTNLTAEEASESTARIMNAMGVSSTEIDRMSAALVKLGINGASTERDILEMTKYLAGAAGTIGATVQDTMGLANALSSIGLEAEAGGSALSRVMLRIEQVTKTNDKSLKMWADTAGLSVQDFKKAWEADPIELLNTFTKGLARLEKEGGSAVGRLRDLSQTDIRVTRALLTMANSGDVVTESLANAAEGWEKNAELERAYGERVETATFQMRVAWNKVRDAMIDVGESGLPVLKDTLEIVAALVDGFSELPGGVKETTLRVAALTTAVTLGMFAMMKFKVATTTMKANMIELGIATDATYKKMMLMRGAAGFAGVGLMSIAPEANKASDGLGDLLGVLGAAATGFAVGGPWGAAIGGAAGLMTNFATNTADAKEQVAALTQTLDEQTGALTKDTKAKIARAIVDSGARDAGAKLGLDLETLTNAAMGDFTAINKVTAKMSEARKGIDESFKAGAGWDQETYNALSKINEVLTQQEGALADAKQGWEEALEIARVAEGDFVVVADALAEATGNATMYQTAFSQIPEEVKTEIKQKGAKSSQEAIEALATAYGLTPEQVKTELILMQPPGDNSIDAWQEKLRRLGATKITPKMRLDANQALADLSRMRSIMDALSRGYSGKLRVTGTTKQAEGSVLDFYANGGVRESHVAQIAPAGAWRVWAEPETGGEAYIPLSPAKRDRSLQIWQETGRRLGAIKSFADGGITGGKPGVAMEARLVSGSLRLIGTDIAELVDARVIVGVNANNDYQSSRRRAGR